MEGVDGERELIPESRGDQTGDARSEVERLIERERSEGRGWKGLTVAVETDLGDETEGTSYRVRVLRREGYGAQTVRHPISTIETPGEGLDDFLVHLTARIRSLGYTGPEPVPDASEEATADAHQLSELSDAAETRETDFGPFMKRRFEDGAGAGRSGEAGLGEGRTPEIGGEEGDDPLRAHEEGNVQPPGARPEWDEGEGREGLPDDGPADDGDNRPSPSWGVS